MLPHLDIDRNCSHAQDASSCEGVEISRWLVDKSHGIGKSLCSRHALLRQCVISCAAGYIGATPQTNKFRSKGERLVVLSHANIMLSILSTVVGWGDIDSNTRTRQGPEVSQHGNTIRIEIAHRLCNPRWWLTLRPLCMNLFICLQATEHWLSEWLFLWIQTVFRYSCCFDLCFATWCSWVKGWCKFQSNQSTSVTLKLFCQRHFTKGVWLAFVLCLSFFFSPFFFSFSLSLLQSLRASGFHPLFISDLLRYLAYKRMWVASTFPNSNGKMMEPVGTCGQTQAPQQQHSAKTQGESLASSVLATFCYLAS